MIKEERTLDQGDNSVGNGEDVRGAVSKIPVYQFTEVPTTIVKLFGTPFLVIRATRVFPGYILSWFDK